MVTNIGVHVKQHGLQAKIGATVFMKRNARIIVQAEQREEEVPMVKDARSPSNISERHITHARPSKMETSLGVPQMPNTKETGENVSMSAKQSGVLTDQKTPSIAAMQLQLRQKQDQLHLPITFRFLDANNCN
mgnify:CR=1 FL=1